MLNRIEKVSVETPARLHLGFLDLHGGLGRSYGSLGVAVEGFRVRLEVTRAATCAATGPMAARAVRVARTLCAALELPGALHIRVHEAIPAHVGLGSGTQLELAVARAILELQGLTAPLRELTPGLGRGGRSGIGIGIFEQGGLVVDGGCGKQGGSPPVLCRLNFPPDWRFLLVLERRGARFSGVREHRAFQKLHPMSEECAGKLCRLVLMGVLPAVCEQDYPAFGRAISNLQENVGSYFSPAQGGSFSSKRVAGALDWLKQRGAPGIGQSSWGPTGYAVYPNAEGAHAAQKQFARHYDNADAIELRVVAACNNGARIQHHRAHAASA